MSFSAFRWAVTQTAPTQSKLILILLANRANDVGQCWPAYKTLAIESGMSRRSVIRSITKLEELGLIRSSHRFKNNENTSNSYTLIMGQVSKPKAVGSGDSMALPSDCVSLPSDW
jgi:DNA-binding transcriptional MocR family regulator